MIHMGQWHLMAAQTNHVLSLPGTNLRDGHGSFDSLEKVPREGLVQCHSGMSVQAGPRRQIFWEPAQSGVSPRFKIIDMVQISASQLVVPKQQQ